MINQSYHFVWSAIVAIGLTTVMSFSTAKAIGGDYGVGNGNGNLAIPELGPADGQDNFHKILHKYEYGASPLEVKESSYNTALLYLYIKDKAGNLTLVLDRDESLAIGYIDMDFLGRQITYVNYYDNKDLTKVKMELQNSSQILKLNSSGDSVIEIHFAMGDIELRKTKDKSKYIGVFRSTSDSSCGTYYGDTVTPVDGICAVVYFYKKELL